MTPMSERISEGDLVKGLGFADYGRVRIINGPFARVKFGKKTVACRLADLTLIVQELRGACDKGSEMEICGVEG